MTAHTHSHHDVRPAGPQEDLAPGLRRRAVIICIVTTATVATAEIILGWWFGLISLAVEGLHTAADLFDSVVAFALVAVASRPADRSHPYGHGKFDSLAAMIEGSFVGVTAAWAIIAGARVLLGVAPAEPRPEPVTLAAMALVSVVYYAVSSYVLVLARRTHSPAVFAEAMHLRTHVYITAGLFIGLVVSRIGLARGWEFASRIDALAALLLGTYLVNVALKIMRPGFRQLMDTALPESELARIAALLERFREEFVEIHAIRTRRSGTERHVDIHLMVDAEMPVQAAHDLSHRIEEHLVCELPGTRLLVHIEPALGAALEDYQRRNRVGRVYVSQTHPLEREATHHASDRAHQP